MVKRKADPFKPYFLFCYNSIMGEVPVYSLVLYFFCSACLVFFSPSPNLFQLPTNRDWEKSVFFNLGLVRFLQKSNLRLFPPRRAARAHKKCLKLQRFPHLQNKAILTLRPAVLPLPVLIPAVVVRQLHIVENQIFYRPCGTRLALLLR